MSRFVLPRRTMLKGILGGVGAAFALPPLEAMFNNNGTAYADGTPLPLNFGTIYFANGGCAFKAGDCQHPVVIPNCSIADDDRWTPTATGANFPISPGLQPFADAKLQQYLTVATNLAYNGFGNNAHFDQQGAAMTGGTNTSIDQLVSQRWQSVAAQKAFFANLHIRSIQSTISGMAQSNNSVGPQGNNGPADYQAQTFFNHVFGVTNVQNGTPTLDPTAKPTASVLDIVKTDTGRLRGKLGKTDQTRLDAFLSNVNATQTQILTPRPVCTTPSLSSIPAFKQPVNGVEYTNENAYPLYDLMAMALACGLTHVFELLFTSAQTDVLLMEATGTAFPGGLDYEYHGIQHATQSAGAFAGDTRIPKFVPLAARRNAVEQAVVYAMTHFAHLAASIAQYQVTDHSLLYHSLLWVASDYGDAIAHDASDVPQLFIGNAGGAIKGNYHFRATGTATASPQPAACNAHRMGLTALKALGFTDTSWGANVTGHGNGLVNSPITEILTGG